ncbi:MAG: beta-ketoacyl synthase N-terminal-like domain-containing protein, partial [Acidimicrobiales bacterium]
MSHAYIVDAVRTPIGRINGALSAVRPDDLAAAVLSGLWNRHDLDDVIIGDVILGNSNGAGEDNRNVARMAVLLASLSTSVPGTTVNRLCGSGMEAVVQASRELEVGDADVVIAGGVESMTRAPWVLPKPDRAFPRDNATMFSSALGWRMVNPTMNPHWTVSLGEGAEILADEFKISREEQDVFALTSHQKASLAWEARHFD